MMDFYSRLIEKPVMSSSGEIIGHVKNFSIDEKWNIVTMIASPASKKYENLPTDDDGNFLIPMANVNVGKDAIVVMNIESIKRSVKQDQGIDPQWFHQ
ncbi:hypothetical protein [Thermoplasma volcanium GSS1]|uniref:PRC-barrel domain-containing protein n=1 Tax=Thermoplasma volcanium (strain ATCC 51530 / DSM 4299 / JCM 9571 / NBRC 15438 / GSS1) TaxID=273116 RepID=Q97A34_THEVO|nr:PRC-barrel domain-containing protein [Thermoplasma volcanium]BAB60118.1 hypothetical protein [Thermoplasma volcanium GSS1]